MTDYRDDPRLDRDVYQPAEDSALLLAAASDRIPRGAVVLEVGVGSGFVASRLAVGPAGVVVGSDVNPHACARSREAGVPAVRGSLLSFVAADSLDVVLFNPPYLPDAPALETDWLERAVAGGPTGADLVVDWLADLPRVLRPGGFGLVVISSLTERDPIDAAAAAHDLGLDVVASRALPFETLLALRVAPLTDP